MFDYEGVEGMGDGERERVCVYLCVYGCMYVLCVVVREWKGWERECVGGGARMCGCVYELL